MKFRVTRNLRTGDDPNQDDPYFEYTLYSWEPSNFGDGPDGPKVEDPEEYVPQWWQLGSWKNYQLLEEFAKEYANSSKPPRDLIIEPDAPVNA